MADKWEGLKVIYVDARGTSSLCAVCGSKLNPNSTDRQLWCPKCEMVMDRDVNASRNILARGLGSALTPQPCEAMVQERRKPNPESRWRGVNLSKIS